MITAAPEVTGARLGRTVLSYLAMTIAVITLSPFRFSLEVVNRLSYEWRNYDVVMNVIMFVPLGFIYQLSRPHGERGGWRGALAVGVLLSSAVETVQFFAPGRFPSLVDVLTNTAGAGLGAVLAIIAFGRVDGAKTVRAFAVELPLMGVAYLLIPLAWLAAIAGGDGARAWCVLFMVSSAAWIIGAVFSSFERAPLQRVIFATAAWLVVALAPTAIASPRRALIAAAIGLAMSWLRAVLPALLTYESRRTEQARRFEARTLRIVLPLLCTYLVVSSLLPVTAPRVSWMGMIPLFPMRQAANITIFRALEHIAAFTVIAYAVAEYGGRTRHEFRTIVPFVLVLAAVVSALLETARGWHRAYGASATMFVLTLLGAGLGSYLYVLQLAHVRALIGRK